MTSCTSPRARTIARYAGSDSSSSSSSPPASSSADFSSSGTKPIRARPLWTSTRPASRASTTAASTSSTPSVIEMMYDSMTSGPNRSCTSRIVANTSNVLRALSVSGVSRVDSGRRPVSSSASSCVRPGRSSAA